MAIDEENVSINPVMGGQKKSGGLLGSVLGGLAGLGAGVAGVFTGGAALPAIPGAIAAGTALGGVAGNMASPAGSGAAPAPVQSVGQTGPMNSMGGAPEVQMATMQNAKNLLSTSNVPNAQQYMDMIDQAHQTLRTRLGTNSTLGS